eukprot:10676691-Ditylum_brightwellii.AAC.1
MKTLETKSTKVCGGSSNGSSGNKDPNTNLLPQRQSLQRYADRKKQQWWRWHQQRSKTMTISVVAVTVVPTQICCLGDKVYQDMQTEK